MENVIAWEVANAFLDKFGGDSIEEIRANLTNFLAKWRTTKMRELTVELGERSYPIYIGQGILNQIAGLFDRAKLSRKSPLLIVTDECGGCAASGARYDAAPRGRLRRDCLRRARRRNLQIPRAARGNCNRRPPGGP